MTKSEQYCYDQGRRELRLILIGKINDWFMENYIAKGQSCNDVYRAIKDIIEGEKP